MILPICGPPFNLCYYILPNQEYVDAIYLSFRGWDLRIWNKRYRKMKICFTCKNKY